MRRARDVLLQAAVLAVVVLPLAWFARNAAHNLAVRHIASGFGFLHDIAGMPIGETPIAWHPAADTYARALLIGVLNTLRVAAVGIVLATVLGTAIGIARLARNWLLSRLAAVYVEALRDVPLLLQLLAWYAVLLHLPPPGAGAWHLGAFGVLCNRGLFLVHPVLGRFNYTAGVAVSTEFLALLAGLVFYTAAYVAETVRGGILAVPRGQGEAAAALGLTRAQTLRHVVLPQALRVIIPPLTGEYLSLVKNSSLAVAIGYPEIVSIADTTLNQTGQAIEGVALIMAAYLTISLLISLMMAGVDARIAPRRAVSRG